MVVQGNDDLGVVLEMLNCGIGWEDSITNEEDKFQEGPELEGSEVTGAIGVFIRPEAQLEYQLDQVINLTGFGF